MKNIDYFYTREGNVSQFVEMSVVRHDVTCISLDGAIYKLIVILVCFDKVEMEIDLYVFYITTIEYGCYNILGYFF